MADALVTIEPPSLPALPSARRPKEAAHHRLEDQLRTKLLRSIKKDYNQIYARLLQLLTGETTRNDEPQVKLMLGLLLKFAPEKRELDTRTAMAGRSPMLLVVQGGVRRGTAAARQEAIEVRAQRIEERAKADAEEETPSATG